MNVLNDSYTENAKSQSELTHIQAARRRICTDIPLKRVIDALIVPCSLLGIFWIYPRDGSQLNIYLILGLVGFAVFEFTTSFTGLYGDIVCGNAEVEVRKLLNTWMISVGVFLLVAYMTKTSDQYSRITVMSWLGTVPTLMIAYRWGLRLLLSRHASRNIRQVAIVGLSQSSCQLAHAIKEFPHLGMSVSGVYSNSATEEDRSYYRERDLPILDLSQIKNHLKQGRFERVFICKNLFKDSTVEELIQDLSDSTVDLFLVPSLDCYDLHHARFDNVMGIPVIGLFDGGVGDMEGLFKRVLDIVLGTIILTVCAIPMSVIAVAITLTMPGGPVIFKQRRYGIDGKEIVIWKFRSMCVCEDCDCSIKQASKDDDRVTPLGRFLRRTSLDELPQFFNVLQGSMSIVGPRPHAVAHNELYRKEIPGYMLRHKVKPGITGLAQVRGYRGATESVDLMLKRVESDIEYIRTWSIFLDVKLIFKTLFVGFVHRNAR